jgi:hypothetical protein
LIDLLSVLVILWLKKPDLFYFMSIFISKANIQFNFLLSFKVIGLWYQCADLNGSVGSISDLKPKGPGFESRIRQGYICWWCGSKRSGCVMNVSPCGFKVKEFALKFPKEPDYQLTTCSTCTVEGKCGAKMGSTLGPIRGPRARVLLTHLNSFPSNLKIFIP